MMDFSAESENSDSDSDYLPENITQSSAKRGSKQSKVTAVKKSKHEIICSNQCPSSTAFTITKLPLELLVMIFQYIVQQCGPFVALKRYGLISKKWRLALLENTLWHSVSLNGKESWLSINKALIWLCNFKHGVVKQLTVSSWKQIHVNTSLQQICRQVKDAEFKDCTLKFDEIFECFVQVEELTIVQCTVKSFTMLVQTCKDTLRHLSLIRVGSSFCHSLTKCDTPVVTLKMLQLDNFGYFRADSVNILQKMCPNLIHLQLAFAGESVSRGVQSEMCLNRFLSLKYLELTFDCFIDNSSSASEHLCLLLAASPNLQYLTLVHYLHDHTLSHDKLASLMSSNLTELVFFHCKLDFTELLSKLLLSCDALQRLAIVNPKGKRVTDNIIATIIASPCASTLQYLDLSGTDVTIDGVRCLLKSVCNLKQLDLLRCRYLPRGAKRSYSSATGLNKLGLQADIMN